MTLTLLHRDESLVVIDKPAGMLVHPGREPEPRDQIAMKVLRDQIGRRVATVHRLDRPTSGVLLFALDERVEKELRKQFEEQSVEKRYAAVVLGKTAEQFVIDTPLQKGEGEPFRESVTEFSRERLVEIEGRTFSLLSVYPRSGRFHQIRKHLAGAGFPIVGDYLYGDVGVMNRVAAEVGEARLMLHARELGFFHPIDGVDMTIRSDLPERFAPFLR